MGLFVWECSVEKMWDWGQGIVLVSEGPSWEGFYVPLYKVVTTIVLVVEEVHKWNMIVIIHDIHYTT